MVKIEYTDLSFEEKEQDILVTFLKLFYTRLHKTDLGRIGGFTIDKNSITFNAVGENKARNKFNALLLRSFAELRNKLTNKRAVYVHKNSGIPLIGNISFGLIDRNTSVIELKPVVFWSIVIKLK